jgi:hypothetical protein
MCGFPNGESNERPHAGETIMDTFREESARPNSFDHIMTSEDKTTHRRWTRGVMGFYGALILLSAIAIFASQFGADTSDQIAQASTRQLAR